MCEHLQPIEEAVRNTGARETSRGQAWSENCREWIYFDCFIDRAAIRQRLRLPGCIADHEHLGTHDGRESGFVCTECKDGILGVHELDKDGRLQVV